MSEDSIKLFEGRKKTYPKSVKGRFRRIKWVGMAALLSIYYLTPWIRWDRGPGMPDQAVLISLKLRRAFIFDMEIWPQEVYLLAGALILAAVGLFFVTSLFGRVWCGYTCPHTVYVDAFVAVEKFFQGDRNERLRLDKQPWNFNKIWRKGATQIVWLVIAFSVGFGWVCYFNDAPALVQGMLEGQLNSMTAMWMFGLMASTFLFAGFVREQVCAHMCPYARFQAAMFDDDTLIIAYDAARGEPRGSHKAGESWENRGHCIDCNQCVVVCPQGIDIRDGLQVECIACGLCIDACDDIMKKVGLPPGLVRYDTNNNAARRAKGLADKLSFLRLRTFYYTIIFAAVSAGMLYSLMTRSPLEVNIIHDRSPLFVTLSDGSIRNGYMVKISNKSGEDKSYALQLGGIAGELTVQDSGEDNPERLLVPKDKVGQFKVFISAEMTALDGLPSKKIMFTVTDTAGGTEATQESMFVGAKNGSDY